MGATLFFRPAVTPKIIQIQRFHDPLWVEPVYGPSPDPDNDVPGPIITAGSWADPVPWMEDVLNTIPEPVYPPTLGRFIWRSRSFDAYSDNPSLRVELWLDTAGTATYSEIIAVFPELPKYVEIAARNWGREHLRSLVNPYEDSERGTWYIQQHEAETWNADNSAPTPMISALAANRGITVADLVGKILGNVNLFRQASGQILGKQQALIDKGYGATTLEELLAVSDSIGIELMSI